MTTRFAAVVRTFTATACLLLLAFFSGAGSADAAVHTPTIDGNVLGFGEGYSQDFNVSLNVENGPTGVTGAKLFLHDDVAANTLFVGFTVPLTLNDNTYGTTRATDWGGIEHFLRGGGNGLGGSDKWEIKIDDFVGSDKLEIKLDYIEETGTAPGTWDTRIEKFKLGGTDLDPADIDFSSSLDYNFNNLGLTSFFDLTGAMSDEPSNSPTVGGAAPTGSPINYGFDAPAAAWLPEIAYEFSITKDAIPGFTLTAANFVSTLFPASVWHMSPNKLGGHKVTDDIPVDPIPEPSTIVVWSVLGLMFTVGSSRRRRRQA